MKPDNRSRSYSANAFLVPNLGRTNLVVLEGATVSKIDLTTSEDVAATGVEYIPDGGSEAVGVPLAEGGSVIVTAGKLLWSNNRLRLIVLVVIGTYQSPKILELSGKYHGAAGI